MRALVHRVLEASVTVNGAQVGRCGPGLLILVCAMPADDPEVVDRLADKITKLRIFRDSEGRMNLNLTDAGGEALVVSQFTLAADTRRGNRPGFSGAAPSELAESLYEHFANRLATLGIKTGRGVFGADMKVALINDGPVTIWLDSAG